MRCLLACLLCLASGCSFLFTTKPPERVTAYTTLDCTTSNAAPVIDGLLSVANAVGTIYESNNGYPAEYIAAGVVWTVIESVAAIYGSSVTSDCREAQETRDLLVEQEARRRVYSGQRGARFPLR